MPIPTTAARVVVKLPRVSALPHDVITNTFWFSKATGSNHDLTDLGQRVRDFYNTVPTGQSKAVASFLARCLSRGSGIGSVTVTDFSTTPETVVNLTMTLGAAAATPTTDFPAEVAIAMTFKNSTATTVPIRRRRGRIYLGPLTANQFTTTFNEITPGNDLFVIPNAAAKDLKLSTGHTTSADWHWAVYSRADSALYDVTDGSVDDAFDTQRRRGYAPSGRIAWS